MDPNQDITISLKDLFTWGGMLVGLVVAWTTLRIQAKENSAQIKALQENMETNDKKDQELENRIVALETKVK